MRVQSVSFCESNPTARCHALTAYGDTDSFFSNSALGLLNHLDLRARRILNSRDYFVMHTITELINLCTYNLILLQPSEVGCGLFGFMFSVCVQSVPSTHGSFSRDI
jgi:hypothetical protein